MDKRTELKQKERALNALGQGLALAAMHCIEGLEHAPKQDDLKKAIADYRREETELATEIERSGVKL